MVVDLGPHFLSTPFFFFNHYYTHWKRPWCWERLGAGGEGDDRGWDGWMASPTRWAWVWVNSGSWWWTGRPGVLRFTGSQRVRHDWATELNWTDTLSATAPPVRIWRKKLRLRWGLGDVLLHTEPRSFPWDWRFVGTYEPHAFCLDCCLRIHRN